MSARGNRNVNGCRTLIRFVPKKYWQHNNIPGNLAQSRNRTTKSLNPRLQAGRQSVLASEERHRDCRDQWGQHDIYAGEQMVLH